ncbi:hypothetical protein HBI49_153730 [Parastagonospora nodorum]|nr:hypothetical protein HBI49_153730 [Parastagonospora nodorum]KAH5635143.1 hypothetical protein HBI51_172570 [Parastagonospora nodorum]KAH5743701.1 hypothetical protein HBI17_156540 [Parastagonospora nodorum]
MMWDTESSRFPSTAGPPDDSGTELVRADQNNVHIPRDRRLGVFTTARWKWSLQDRSWRLGLHVGLYASIIVLFGNVALLSYGMAQHDNTTQGVATIAKGERDQINSIGNAYHVLINIMSTILLTSSNYTMQILCAPTRREIERMHARGDWLEIGIMSIHNLRYIDRKRVAIWLLLVVSSLPLHLL